MRNNKHGLDEMQLERRNSIGNQMFMLMFYALFIDCGLYGYGVRWINYPVNVMVIITICMSIYLVRLIAQSAYLPPKAQNKKTVIALVLSVTLSIIFANTAMRLFGPPPGAEAIEDNSAIVLMITSAVGLVATLIAAIISKMNNRADEGA